MQREAAGAQIARSSQLRFTKSAARLAAIASISAKKWKQK